MKTNDTYTTGRMMREADWLLPEYRARLLASPKPRTLCGAKVPDNLRSLTLDQLEDISLTDGMPLRERVAELVRVILGVTDARLVEDAPAADTCGFVRWVGEEMRRTAELFASITPSHTDEERAAGVERLKFGIFGLADWYARRMGISDHNEAKRVPWVRIYECARMDFLTAEYQRRLAEIRRNRARTPRHR